MLKVNLAGEGYGIREASDGDEVLPLLAATEVDLILLDMKMARLDGIATLTCCCRPDTLSRLFCLPLFPRWKARSRP